MNFSKINSTMFKDIDGMAKLHLIPNFFIAEDMVVGE